MITLTDIATSLGVAATSTDVIQTLVCTLASDIGDHQRISGDGAMVAELKLRQFVYMRELFNRNVIGANDIFNIDGTEAFCGTCHLPCNVKWEFTDESFDHEFGTQEEWGAEPTSDCCDGPVFDDPSEVEFTGSAPERDGGYED